jgi:hypothetical protein
MDEVGSSIFKGYSHFGANENNSIKSDLFGAKKDFSFILLG